MDFMPDLVYFSTNVEGLLGLASFIYICERLSHHTKNGTLFGYTKAKTLTKRPKSDK